MALSFLSSSLPLTRLISTFNSPISGRNPSPPLPTTLAPPFLKLPTTLAPLFLKMPTTLAPNSGRMMMMSGLQYNPSPCLMLPPTLEDGGGEMVYNFYDLSQNKVINFNNNKIPEEGARIVGSSHGWLALFNERNGDLILTNPVTRRHVKLPPTNEIATKVIISCDAEQDECQAMMVDGLSCRLTFCRLGRSPTGWTPIGGDSKRLSPFPRPRLYEDFVYSSRHKLFLCVTKTELGDDLEGWDVASDSPRLRWENRDDLLSLEKYYYPCLSRAGEFLDDNAIELLEDNEGLCCETFKYLVFAEQADQLFLVIRQLVRQMAPDGSAVDSGSALDDDCYPYKTVVFDVYKIDLKLEGGGLSYVDGGSLGGLAMFVGRNHSFAVLATEANGLKPNSIYFTDDKELTPLETWADVYGGHDIGIFDCENRTISPCYYPCDIQSFKRIVPAPIWFTPTHN